MRLAPFPVQKIKIKGECFMRRTQKNSIFTAALLALLTTSVGYAWADHYDRYGSGRYDRWDRQSRLDLDRDGRVERWERNRWDRDRDGRVERWELNRGPSRYSYYGRDNWRDNWRYDRYSDSRYRDRYDR
jgi:hypothetical protein